MALDDIVSPVQDSTAVLTLARGNGGTLADAVTGDDGIATLVLVGGGSSGPTFYAYEGD